MTDMHKDEVQTYIEFDSITPLYNTKNAIQLL